MRLQITIFTIFTVNFLFGQNNYVWKHLDGNFYQSTISQNSKEILNESDSLTLTLYNFNENEEIDLLNSSKQTFKTIKITFENFKEKLSINKFDPILTKNSEFLVKYQNTTKKTFEYEIYLLDSATKENIEALKSFLKENFETQKIEYISKAEAMNIAAETIGINPSELFEDNIFPASLKLNTIKKVNLKTIEAKFKNSVDSSVEKNPETGIHIFRIET